MPFVVVVDREGPVGAFADVAAAAAALSPYHLLSFIAYEFVGEAPEVSDSSDAEVTVWVIPADGQANAIVYAGFDEETARDTHALLKTHDIVPPDDLDYFCREFGVVWAEQRLALAMTALETPAAQASKDEDAVDMFTSMLTGQPAKKDGPDESLPKLASIQTAVMRGNFEQVEVSSAASTE